MPESRGLGCAVEVVLLDKFDGIDIRIGVRVDPKGTSAPNVGGDRKLEGRQSSIEAAFPVDRDRDVIVGDPPVAEAVGRRHSLLPFLQLRALEGKQGLLHPEDPAVATALRRNTEVAAVRIAISVEVENFQHGRVDL